MHLKRSRAGQMMPGELKQIAPFADEGLTQIIIDYTPVLASEQAEVDAAVGALLAPTASG